MNLLNLLWILHCVFISFGHLSLKFHITCCKVQSTFKIRKGIKDLSYVCSDHTPLIGMFTVKFLVSNEWLSFSSALFGERGWTWCCLHSLGILSQRVMESILPILPGWERYSLCNDKNLV